MLIIYSEGFHQKIRSPEKNELEKRGLLLIYFDVPR